MCQVYLCNKDGDFFWAVADTGHNSMSFYQKFIFKLNMINFSMWTKVKLSWFPMCHTYDVIKQLSK